MDENEMQPEIRFVKALREEGIDNAHIIRQETATRVMTDKRIELLREIAADPPESMRALARRVDRDIGRVSHDLDVLSTAHIIEYETDGRSKRPTLAARNVFVEPIVFDGEVLGGGE